MVLFDGTCNLCNRSVQILLRLDRGRRLRYAALQGNWGQTHVPGPVAVESTMFFWEKGKLFGGYEAVLRIGRVLYPGLRFLFDLLAAKTLAYPGQRLYAFIARNRYAWFGQSHCLMPDPDLLLLFLD